ncbi:proton-conducting transporter transmembrane domain-containing protein [Varunaivibrio sulfuroxidans]|uniref:Formate hydrogenlyase subunit 3/multisubunit Na+/H+ antiporter MnhD subunit n=1 Tax=Varunaivibrio sulfuroxidans TaxID=1773489 RepID=A0A4R3JFP0_9PROT|nr:proton-conducting transporter membrane subunit [Varunaivibrio sulfuroxidans]TCS64694.1 formate hydrogenlyase subunit 3/multisubunit Na+/H+ antiporter MnhD subunit [Varunaivibrio sulfuroxidans]WES29999.1 proton-conducting transporter membrane subunit [Varunaivibrio sulfuroxidans]
MVNPIFIIAGGLGAAFLLGLLRDTRRGFAYGVTLAALALMSGIAADWVWAFAVKGAAGVDVFTAGHRPPFAINLRMAPPEAVLVLLVSVTGLLSAIYLKEPLLRLGRGAMAVLLIAILALSGIILTRDVFNLFVFIELTAISTAGLVLLSDDARALGAGFKYLMVSQIISILLLIGIIFAYHATGTLNIDGLAGASAVLMKGGTLAVFLVIVALIAELKPFPANGWALDIYESAHPAFSAIFSAASGAAALFAVDKVLVIGGAPWLEVATGVGIVTFVGANILALSQRNDRRLLGYSSVAQIGLVLTVIGQRDILGEHYLFIAGGILLAHGVAKAGLYWLSGLVAERELSAWAALRQNPLLIFAFVSFIAMLIGLPPFPGFYAKWQLAHILIGEGRFALVGMILFAALLEAGYLFRWFGYIIKRAPPREPVRFARHKLGVVLFAVAAAWGVSYIWGALSGLGNVLHALPLLFALGFLLLEGLPAWAKNALAIVGMVAFFIVSYPAYNPLQVIFATIILIGGAVILLASFATGGRRIGFYPSAMVMYAGLAMLIVAKGSFAFFTAWEVLTVGSYFLILRGKRSEPHALSYIVFSLGGAFAILFGFALAAGGAMQIPIAALGQTPAVLAPWVFLLLAIGFMTKTAAIGLHVWLPGAHAEAETDVSPMVSGILLKAGLFGLMVLLLNMGKVRLYGVELTYVMLWIGALSALLGNLMAVFQEDAKRLLAYSSIGQMGYALFGLAMMNHLGWLMALMFVINHYVYKSMLFLSVGGVAKRTGTRDMYRMGGLITLMPLSFVAVLVGIIAVSGVPPLSGFGGRWIFYNAILTADYRLPMIVIFLSGPVAFLYLFRLIHTIFLGQMKDEHRRLKEAPFWIILPQMIYVAFLLAFAVFPGLALRRVDAYLAPFFPKDGLDWQGLTITSGFGYWSPVSIMIIVVVIFATVLAGLVLLNHKAQRVKQFNIVFAAERPYRPETTHFAWNFFAPYRKAVGFLVQPFVTRFWDAVAGTLHHVAEFTRRFYTGNGQTYAFHFLAFVVVVYLFVLGGGS